MRGNLYRGLPDSISAVSMVHSKKRVVFGSVNIELCRMSVFHCCKIMMIRSSSVWGTSTRDTHKFAILAFLIQQRLVSHYYHSLSSCLELNTHKTEEHIT